MKKLLLGMVMGVLFGICTAQAEGPPSLEEYVRSFDYEARLDMKIDSKGLLPLLVSGQGVLVDIRFAEEVAVWRTGFALTIPLNELPARLAELPKDKIIVTACPHKDRSIIAMTYLRTKGYQSRYLTDGLIGLAELLRGDRALDLAEELSLIRAKPAASPVGE
ncbi:rhodanese-like domain-containing protein [Trichloromonas sp.]|uniref:rhodanese-like domain-containing protein n=1 Tax=Trichloromonas sp. TaxID=3069249 RepID=UPI003D819E09